jgi:hypothetical protein
MPLETSPLFDNVHGYPSNEAAEKVVAREWESIKHGVQLRRPFNLTYDTLAKATGRQDRLFISMLSDVV